MDNAVYRCYDDAGELMYIGCSKRLCSRLNWHRRNTSWGKMVHRVDAVNFTSRKDALAAEARAIADEQPPFNKNHRFRRGRHDHLGPRFHPKNENIDAQCRDLWLDPERPEVYKLRRIGEIHGSPVARGQLFYRYGTAEKPKPQR